MANLATRFLFVFSVPFDGEKPDEITRGACDCAHEDTGIHSGLTFQLIRISIGDDDKDICWHGDKNVRCYSCCVGVGLPAARTALCGALTWTDLVSPVSARLSRPTERHSAYSAL